tara:strand:+ start:4202 stop:4948 length:747 start_codon:yes stop_codon:yes gene_type:complete
MSNTVIIIPSRLKAKRLPDKPLKLINGKEMIIHVHDVAKKSGAGEVLVATADKEIDRLVKKNNGMSFLSLKQHETGSDRVYEAFNNFFSSKPEVIINLQGDMPNLKPETLMELRDYMLKGKCDIATLASSIKDNYEIDNENIVKVTVKDDIKKTRFSHANDFNRKLINSKKQFIYHHIGIYAFTKEALLRYVNLERSKLEIERNLEQMRAMENKMEIHVGYTSSNPLSVDTPEDLEKVRNEMEKNEKN